MKLPLFKTRNMERIEQLEKELAACRKYYSEAELSCTNWRNRADNVQRELHKLAKEHKALRALYHNRGRKIKELKGIINQLNARGNDGNSNGCD